MTHVSSPKTSENTQESQKSSAVLWRLCTWKSRKHSIIWILQPCNIISVVPIFLWIRLSQWMCSPRNAVVVVPIFRWIHLSPWMFSPRNSVRVVLLIAQGWRGTSLPWVSIRKEIQRHRCWAFSMKACLKRCNLLRINQKKRNTYGVVPCKPYVNPG